MPNEFGRDDTRSPQEAPDRETELTVDFEKGFPVGLNGKKLSPLAIVEECNRLGAENAIGRADLVEKPGPPLGGRRQRHELYGQVPMPRFLPGQEHHPRAPAPQLAHQPVALPHGSPERVE